MATFVVGPALSAGGAAVIVKERNDMVTSQFLILNFGTGEILLIALVVLLLFGGKKIPELMRGLGKGVKDFRDGMEGKPEEPARKDPEDKA